MKEYEIFKQRGVGISYPTGVVVLARSKKDAIQAGRRHLGKGTYEAHESSPQIRAEQQRRAEEVRAKLAAQPIPTIVVGADGGLRAEGES